MPADGGGWEAAGAHRFAGPNEPGPGSGPGGAPPVRPLSRRERRRLRRRRRTAAQRVLRWSVAFVGLLLVLVGGLYGYVRYQWGRVRTVACAACAAGDGTQPFNVLIVGSDSRAGNTGSAAQAFGSASQVGGQRSDTIKIIHVDPAAGTARMLSIPRDTFVHITGLAAGSPLAADNKINAAFDNGPNSLVSTIEDTFGIPIQHFVTVDFGDEVNLVNAVGGIRLDFPYPARDNDNGNNNSGLTIPTAGCQTLNGSMALALSRSRFYQYYSAGSWHSDPTSDIGRIERQNIVIQAVIDKARTLVNPVSLNSLLSTMVQDITVDRGLSFSMLLSLAEQYHAFSGSRLTSYTLPTAPQVSSYAGDILVVQQPQAQQMIAAFLGGPPQAVSTPPVDQYGQAVVAPTGSGSSSSVLPTTGGAGGAAGGTSASGSGSAAVTVTPTVVPSYDPHPC
ncbi:MAG: LCP family protein [Actinomycetota bacterium]|nr:LCP family protein [Actinomycetota bacterium]